MFCLLAAQGLFLVSNRRYSGEILLLLLLVRIGILFKLDVIEHSDWTVYVCEGAMLNMITDGNGVCVCVRVSLSVCMCVCGYVGRQDRRPAGRDNCSNLSSPSHSHPSAQTSKSLPLRLTLRAHAGTHPHTYAHTHRILISTLSPTPISVFAVLPSLWQLLLI